MRMAMGSGMSSGFTALGGSILKAEIVNKLYWTEFQQNKIQVSSAIVFSYFVIIQYLHFPISVPCP